VIRPWLLALATVTLACQTPRTDAAAGHADDGAEHADEHGHAEDDAPPGASADVVRIERGMLRDLRVTTELAESRPAGETAVVLGEIQVNEDAYAEIGAPIAARVSRVLAAPGDQVQAGQVLVELTSPEVGKARAELRSAEARRALARQTFERRRALAVDKIVSERELETTRAELAQAESESLGAREILEALGATRGDGPRFSLSSPIAGTIIARSALLGRRVDTEQPLFVVGDLQRLWLIVHAFERDALRMRPGTSARVSFPALPSETTSGAVTRIGSRVDPASRTVDVRIEIENPTRELRPGMSASALVALGGGEQTVVAVPVEALQRSDEGWRVFLPTAEEGVFQIRAVGRGRDLDGEVEVLSGLTAGERVVKDGAFLLAAEAEKSRGGGEHHH